MFSPPPCEPDAQARASSCLPVAGPLALACASGSRFGLAELTPLWGLIDSLCSNIRLVNGSPEAVFAGHPGMNRGSAGTLVPIFFPYSVDIAAKLVHNQRLSNAHT